jgi:starch synthase (maltosyl-transferring)
MSSATGLIAPNVERAVLKSAIEAPRICIERIAPYVDGGQVPAKGIVGQSIEVAANIFMDGHDLLAARLIWRGPGMSEEQSTPMLPLGNDRWRAAFVPVRPGRHRFNIEAWRDDWGSYRSELARKSTDGLPALIDIEEGRTHLLAAVARAAGSLGDAAPFVHRLELADGLTAAQLLLSDEAAALMARVQQRRFVTHLPTDLIIEVERLAAGFASWYELFPRSQPLACGEHGTLRRCDRAAAGAARHGLRCAVSAADSSDRTQPSQGPQQFACRQGAEDPGSPYAIGAAEGGHTALLPELGGIEAFRRLLAAAAEQAWRWRWTLPAVLARSSLADQSPGVVLLARRRLDTLRRESSRRNTRISSTSISTPIRPDRRCGWLCAMSCCIGSMSGSEPFGSTIHTPSRCRSGSG